MAPIPEYLQHNLRTAMSIELTTIPAYLYAYWSIRPTAEGGSLAAGVAARTIMSVVDEEMLHMGLVSNILNALGGTPAITDPEFLPVYPDVVTRRVIRQPTLLKAEEPPMVVLLAPLSPETIQVFMRIELPQFDDPQPVRDGEWQTIGQFYATVAEQLRRDPELVFQPVRQLGGQANPGAGRMLTIRSRTDALNAMALIVEQGEGTSQSTTDDGDHELAHYWKFQEVGDQIRLGTIDLARDVYPLVANPGEHLASYTPDQQHANQVFNMAYSNLLDALQATFTSETPDVFRPSAHLDAPVAYMEQMGQLAAVLRNQGTVPGTQLLAGPTFEYLNQAGRIAG
ncbi:MAG: ferritin-like protein [Roseiflexaceae bacterium]